MSVCKMVICVCTHTGTCECVSVCKAVYLSVNFAFLLVCVCVCVYVPFAEGRNHHPFPVDMGRHTAVFSPIPSNWDSVAENIKRFVDLGLEVQQQ